MNLLEAIKKRHSVRSFTDKKIEGDVLVQLKDAVAERNKKSGLRIQLVLDEPTAFSGMMASYGKFENVNNYIAFVGKKAADLEEKVGYYGEQIVLKAQQLGLNTCWVAMSFSRGKAKKNMRIDSGEKLCMIVPVGYGKTQGVQHKTKSIEELSTVSGLMPDWFKSGMEAVQLAPTAMNQQKFKFELSGDDWKVSKGSGFYTKVDLGIAKYHFEIGSGVIVNKKSPKMSEIFPH